MKVRGSLENRSFGFFHVCVAYVDSHMCGYVYIMFIYMYAQADIKSSSVTFCFIYRARVSQLNPEAVHSRDL